MNQWRSLENRLGIVFGVSAVLLVSLIFGKLVSVYPLSRCRIGQKKIQKLANEPIFSDPWRLRDLRVRWTIAKVITLDHKLNTLLFNRWGLSNIEPQVMIFANAKNAETYLQGLILGSLLGPSMLSYVLAYDQFNKSDDNRLALVHVCIVIVYLCTSTVFDEWDCWTHFNFIKQTPAVSKLQTCGGRAIIKNYEAQKKKQ
ncbi:hypothetical protein QQ045_026671 [Rhodiola kirilowii]